MLKHLEISDPNSCLNEAQDDEPIFVLRAKDLAAPMTVMFWCEQRIMSGKETLDDPKIKEAYEWAKKAVRWRQEYDAKNSPKKP